MMHSSDTIRLKGFGIKSLKGLDEIGFPSLRFIDLSDNLIESFSYFGTHDDLLVLHLERNQIKSMLSLTRQKKLMELYLDGNPIVQSPFYRIMALVTIGFSLKKIDGVSIRKEEIILAEKLGVHGAVAVSCGWIPDHLNRTKNEYIDLLRNLRQEEKLIRKNLQVDTQLSVGAVLASSSLQPLLLLEKRSTTPQIADPCISKASNSLMEPFSSSSLPNDYHTNQKSICSKNYYNVEKSELEPLQVRPKNAEACALSSLKKSVSFGLQGLGSEEIECAEHIIVSDGISIEYENNLYDREEFSASQRNPISCVIDLMRQNFSVLHFFTRNHILDYFYIEIIDSETMAMDDSFVIRLKFSSGLSVRLTFSTLIVCTMVQKILHLKSPEHVKMPLPDLFFERVASCDSQPVKLPMKMLNALTVSHPFPLFSSFSLSAYSLHVTRVSGARLNELKKISSIKSRENRAKSNLQTSPTISRFTRSFESSIQIPSTRASSTSSHQDNRAKSARMVLPPKKLPHKVISRGNSQRNSLVGSLPRSIGSPHSSTSDKPLIRSTISTPTSLVTKLHSLSNSSFPPNTVNNIVEKEVPALNQWRGRIISEFLIDSDSDNF